MQPSVTYHIKVQYEEFAWIARVWCGAERGNPDFTIRSSSKRLLMWKLRRNALDRRFAQLDRERAQNAINLKFTR